jgi:hypothetical protein
MQIKRASVGESSYSVTDTDLALINRYALGELTREDVFAFPIKLCDNAVDRDNECFPLESLKALAALYVGKPGIFDHCWTASGQSARIFRTEVVPDSGPQNPATGEEYAYLRAYAYILRTEDSADLITRISGGILKEVSVGCSCGRRICSICGNELPSAECSHQLGKEYAGKICVGLLKDPTDAYEWSFVAVPSQRDAGVTKSLDPAGGTSAEDTTEEDEDLVAVEKLRFGGI